MEIRKFSGDPKKWQTFIDSFDSTVHASTTLSDVQQFSYLQGYFEGDALTSISGLALTFQNYTHTPDIIISSHINILVKFPALSEKDDVYELRKLLDEVNSHMRSVCTLEVQKDNHGTMLVIIILEKLLQDGKLLDTRNMTEDIWDLKSMFIINNGW